MTKIYKLIDPRNNVIMYVGKTYMTFKKRMYAHIDTAKKGKTNKDLWIKELLSLKLKPIIELIEEVDNSIWQEREIYWIDFYKKINNNILNIAIGGSIGGVYLTSDKQNQVLLLQSEIKSKPVYQLTKKFEIIKLHKSCKQASKEVNISDTCINTSARSIGNKSAAGFMWIYYTDIDKVKNITSEYSLKYDYLHKSVTQCTKKGSIIKKWNSLIEAANTLQINNCGISKAKTGYRKTYKGFIWK